MPSGWATDGPAIPGSFRAASCSVSRSPARWCMRPRLILADEPTGNLDPDTAAQVIALLGRTVKERGAAMLLVTHSPLAAATADRQLMLTPHGLVPADG